MNRYINEIFVGNKNSKILNMLNVTAQEIPNKTVNISPGVYLKNNIDIVEFNGYTTPEITFPVTGFIWVMVILNESNSIELIYGQNSSQLQQTKDPSIPLALIYIKNDDTAITENMIYDIKPYFHIFNNSIITNGTNTSGTDGSSSSNLPDKSYWYGHISDQSSASTPTITPINSANIFLSKSDGNNGTGQITIDGTPISTYNVYNATTGSMTFLAKTTFNKNKNDIINWNYLFVNAINHNWAYREFITVPLPVLGQSWNGYGYAVIRIRYPGLFIENNVITVKVNSETVGIINDRNGSITFSTNTHGSPQPLEITQSITDSDTELEVFHYYTNSIGLNINTQDSRAVIGTVGSYPFYDLGTYTIVPKFAITNSSEHVNIFINNIPIGTMTQSNKNVNFEYLSTSGISNMDIVAEFVNFTNPEMLFEFDIVNESKQSIYGNYPHISIADDCVIIFISDLYNSKSGTLTLTPKLYDENLNLIKTNNSINIITDLYDSSVC